MVGDVVFFKKSNSLISKTIAKITKSEYTHVGLIIEEYRDGHLKIIESNRFVNTREVEVELDEELHVIYEIEKTEEQKDRIIKYAKSSLGMKYDYFQILGLFLSLIFNRRERALFNSSNKLICSELIDLSYYKAGIKRNTDLKLGNITPQELLIVYDFKEKKG